VQPSLERSATTDPSFMRAERRVARRPKPFSPHIGNMQGSIRTLRIRTTTTINLALVGNGGGLFLFHLCRDFFRGDVERGGQRVVRADGTRPIKSQRFFFHQRWRIEASDQLARKE
jgi:hypothetical protein